MIIRYLFKTVFKNVSSSTSHIKFLTSVLTGFLDILSSTFIYQGILMKIHIASNIIKAQIYWLKFDLRGHWRSHNLTPNPIKTLKKC